MNESRKTLFKAQNVYNFWLSVYCNNIIFAVNDDCGLFYGFQARVIKIHRKLLELFKH